MNEINLRAPLAGISAGATDCSLADLPLVQAFQQAKGQSDLTVARPTLPAIPVRELDAEDRSRLLTHFMALGAEDRLLRFGHMVSDSVVENYVKALDFERDSIFGVFDDQLQLLGVGHLAYLRPVAGKRSAELGVSVLEQARGQGIGTFLFERAAIRCRNTATSSLYMHCLSHNGTMMRIAKRAGMSINLSYGEADAYLTLPPADQASLTLEKAHESAAARDYASKRRGHRAHLA